MAPSPESLPLTSSAGESGMDAFAHALPLELRETAQDAEQQATGGAARIDAPAHTDVPIKEYEHTGESLLRNEEDGEKRVTVFTTLAGAIGAILAFLLGKDPNLRPESIEPLVIFPLIVVIVVSGPTGGGISAPGIDCERGV